MFLLSLKSLKGKLILLVATVAALAVVFYVISDYGYTGKIALADGALDFSASTEEERLHFISQLGLSVEKDPAEVKNVLIPDYFNQTYSEYNEIQKKCGFNLDHYKGCTVKKWTYTVSDYPGYENTKKIKLTLLVYKGRVIGGDICSVELDGFMKGLTK